MMLSLFACGKDKADVDTTTLDTKVTTVEDVAVTDAENTSVPDNKVSAEGTVVGASYFDDAAFVGDSVSLRLTYYAMGNGKLGNAQFFTAGSLGANNALWEVSDESVHPSFRGEKMLIEDCVAQSGVKKVCIMLGMNDLGLYGIDATVESYKTLVMNIIEKSPEVEIVVQSMTPMTSTSYLTSDGLNNDVIREYNIELLKLCEEQNWKFMDVASVMYDEDGNLIREYCSDPDEMGVHFEDVGCDAWVEYLYKNIAN